MKKIINYYKGYFNLMKKTIVLLSTGKVLNNENESDYDTGSWILGL